MKNIKKTGSINILALSLLIININIIEINANQETKAFIDTQTGELLNNKGNASLSLELQDFLQKTETVQNTTPSLSTETVIALKKLINKTTLTDQDNILLGSLFITIDIVNTFQDLLTKISDKDAQPANERDIISFITWSAGRANFNKKPCLEQLKEDINITIQEKPDATNSLIKGILNYIEKGLIDEISNETPEEATAITQGLGLINRIITQQLTTDDHMYFTIVNGLIQDGQWVQNLFDQANLRDNFKLSIVDILLSEDMAASALDYSSTLEKSTQDTLHSSIKELNNLIWSDTLDPIIMKNNIIPEITNSFIITACNAEIKINEVSEKIITFITQHTANQQTTISNERQSVTLIQLIQDGKKQITKSYIVTANTLEEATSTAKSIAETSLQAIQVLSTGFSSSANALEALQQELIKTGKISEKDCIQSTYEQITDLRSPLSSAIVNTIKNKIAIDPVLVTLQTIHLLKLRLKEQQKTPNSFNPTQKEIEISAFMASKLLESDPNIIKSLQELSSDEELIIDAFLQVNKKNIIDSVFNNYSLEDLIGNDGNYLFNIDELVKDNIAVAAAKEHITRLSNAATSRFDKINANALLSAIDTAVENRPPQLTDEEEIRYNQLNNDLNSLKESNNPKNILDWTETLNDNDWNLIKENAEVEILKISIDFYNQQNYSALSVNELVEMKKRLNNFIIEAENFGYGSLLNPLTYDQHILVKAGINSIAQQQKLLDTTTIIDTQLVKILQEKYKSETNWVKFLDSLINTSSSLNDSIKAFRALTNESKVYFIKTCFTDRDGKNKKTYDSYIAKALQSAIDNATTVKDLINLQKETFFQKDQLLNGLQNKIKDILVEEYSYKLTPTDKKNFSKSILDPKDFSDYSRAFKTLSLSEQNNIHAELGISDTELETFQRNFLADKIFYAKTIDEINRITNDINTINELEKDYFNSARDIKNKHGFDSIGDALTKATTEVVINKINLINIYNKAIGSDANYLKESLINMTSQDPYSSAFRQLPLSKQYEIAETFNIHTDADFKKFQNDIFSNRCSVATSQKNRQTLDLLINEATKLNLNSAIISFAETNSNKLLDGTIPHEAPLIPSGSPLDLNQIVKQEENSAAQDHSITPPKEPTAQEFSEQIKQNTPTIPKEFFGTDEEEARIHDNAVIAERRAQEEKAKNDDAKNNDHPINHEPGKTKE